MCNPPETRGTGLSISRKPRGGTGSVPTHCETASSSVKAADGTERFHRNACRVCARASFSLFGLVFLIPQSVSILASFMGVGTGAGVTMSVNKSQRHGQRPLEAAGRVASVSQAPAGDSRVEFEAKPLCLAGSSGKIPQENVRTRNNYFAVRGTTALWPSRHGNGKHQEKWI